MDKQYLESRITDFMNSLNGENADLVSLFFPNRIIVTEEGKPGYFPLDERYATKEQITRMGEVFNRYWDEHPI